MLIIATIPFTAQGIPPRCRNFRSMDFSTDVSAEIPDVQSCDAPIAFELHCTERSWDPEHCRRNERGIWRPFRSFRGKVWVEAGIPTDDLTPHLKRLADEGVRHSARQHEAEHIIHTRIAHWAARIICIDGVLWEPGEEPAITLHDSYYRQQGYHLSLTTAEHELERIDDGAVYRLDELPAATAAVDQLNATLDEEVKADIRAEPFCLEDRVRAIRPDLLTRPTQKDHQAQVRYVEAMSRMHAATAPLDSLLIAISTLTESIAAGHVPVGCDPATARRVHELVRDLDAALKDRRLSGRCPASDDAEPEEHAA